MSVASEITRLQGAKASIKSAIEAKGVTVPSNALLDSFATYIAQISGGGSTGLVYETGTYTPAEDIARPTISFTNQHTDPPAFVAFYDTGQTITSNSSGVYFNYVDPYRLFSAGYTYNDSSNIRYATVTYGYKGSGNSISTGTQHCMYNSDTAEQGSSYARYYVTPTGFKPYTSSGGRYWRSNRTYKWIAIWK